MTMLYNLYNNPEPGGRPVQIEAASEIAIVLELIDVGYLEPGSFIINKAFSEIKSLWYRGGDPFTETGSAMFHQSLREGNKDSSKFRYIALFLILTILLSLLFFII